MNQVEAKYYSKYALPLRSVTQDFLLYFRELKATLPASPWFASLVFRSLVEEDDRQRAQGELKGQLALPDSYFQDYAFLVTILFKEPYHVKVVENSVLLVRKGQTLMEDQLMMMTEKIPPKAKLQWETLLALTYQANQTDFRQ